MYYAFLSPDSLLVRPGGHPFLTVKPRAAVELSKEQFDRLISDPGSLWYRAGVVAAVNQGVTLQEARDHKGYAIAEERDRRAGLGLPYDFPDGSHGTIPLSVLREQFNVTGLGAGATALAVSGATADLPFHDKEGNAHTLSPEQTMQMGVVAMNYVAALDLVARQHVNNLNSLNTIEAVESYDYSGGWP